VPVLDTSLVMAYLLNEPEAAAVLRLITAGQGQAPDLLLIESANALVNAVRRQRLTAAQVPARQALVERLPVHWHPAGRLVGRALDLALAYQRRPYALAEALDTELLTLDLKLVRGLEGTPLAHRVRMLAG
jgi:predicted nucleic acid-binding protein